MRLFFSHKFVVFICLFFFLKGNYKVYAQSYEISTDSVQSVKNGQIYTQIVAVFNQTDNDLNGELKVQLPDNIKSVAGTDVFDVQVNANSKKYIPIRYYIGKELEDNDQKINFYLFENSYQVTQFSTKLELTKIRRIQMFPVEPRVLMRHPGDSLHIEARIINGGNQKEKIKIITSFPLADGGRIPLEKEMTIDAFSEKTVRFSRIVDKDLLSFEIFSVNIAALYENNEYASNTIINVNNASGNRVFSYPNQMNIERMYARNQVRLNYRDIGNTAEAFNINSNGRYAINKSEIAFSLDATRWTNANVSPLMTNTWLQWQNQTKSIQAGTINENNADFNINGRGIRTKINDSDHTKSLEIGIVDKKFNLLDPLETSFDNGFTVFGKLTRQPDFSNIYSNQIIYDESFNGVQSGLFSQAYKYIPKNSDFRFSINASGGLSKSQYDNEEIIKPSGALEVSSRGKWSEYQWQTNNYVSSSYFPGIRRGVLSSDNRISRSFKKSMVWGTFGFYRYQPQFLNTLIVFQNNFSNSRAEIGTSFFLSKNIRWNISKKYNRESGDYFMYQTEMNQNHSLENWMLNNTLSINSNNQKHFLFLLTDFGISNVSYRDNPSNLFRTTLTYSYDAFSLNANFQQGSFLLVEGIMNELQLENPKMYRHSIVGNYQKSFFKNRLQTNVSLMYNNDSFAGKTWMYMINLEYKLSRWTSFYASVNSFRYNQSFSFNQQSRSFYQVGLSQALPGTSKKSGFEKTGNIEILVFYDMNSNGIFDEGDIVAPDRIVTLNKTTFVSQKDGTIIYRRVPYGDYRVIATGKKWYAPSYTLTVDQKKVKHYLALQETGIISGKIQYDYDAVKNYEAKPVFAGINIEFKNQYGIKFNTKTNEKGEFSIHIPKGEYTVDIVSESLQENVYFDDSIPLITLNANERKNIEQPLILKVKEKEIKIRRFGE